MQQTPTTTALLGRGGDWPFAGAFHGSLPASASGSTISWAGRVTSGTDLQMAWRASRAAHNALMRMGPVDADRRRTLSIVWARLDGVSRDLLGPNAGDGLVLLLAAQDADGLAVSAVGLRSVLSADAQGPVSTWVAEPHPLLSLSGLPSERPGALMLDGAPQWLVGVPTDVRADVVGHSVTDVLMACGVHP